MALTVIVPAPPAAPAAAILRLTDGKILDLPGLVSGLAAARVVFFGETHNQPGHHQAQLELIQALIEQGRPVSVALEMFEAGSQGDLDRWTAGKTDLSDFLPVYHRNWAIPWTLYRDIFLFARDRRIPLVALNVPRDITRQVARDGFASLTEDQKKRLPGVSCDVTGAYEEFIRRALGDESHADTRFRRFCEAQMVWDTVMARNLDEYLKKEPGRTVVVLAGSGHSWKPGVPAQLAKRSAVPWVVVLPELPGRLDRSQVTARETDYLWLGITLLPR